MRRGLLLCGLLGTVGLAGAAPVASAGGEREARDVLVLALPTLEWADLHQGDTPELDALVDDSAVASLSVRGIGSLTEAPEAYATISSGARAGGVAESGDVLEVEEDFYGTAAGDAFRRATGEEPGSGLVSLGTPAMVRRNASLSYDAEVGLLGRVLAAQDIPRAVIANADGTSVLHERSIDRTAGISLVDDHGRLPGGAVSADLLAPDPSAPFGVAYDRDAVLETFDRLWATGGVVLVEGSDLARVDRYRPLATPAQQERLRRDALRRTDQLVGGLLARVDLATDAVLVVGPYPRGGTVHLTVAALHAPGQAPGLLRSPSTRRSGYVTLVDVAPTILDQVGATRPEAMEGRAVERSADGAANGADRAEAMADNDAAARYRDRMVAPVALLWVILQAALCAAGFVALGRRDQRFTDLVAWSALSLLVFLPATYVAGAVAFHHRPGPAYWVFVLGLAVLGGGLAAVVGRRRSDDPLILALVAVFGLLVVDMVVGAPLQMNTVFGYSPTVGGRFAGMGNLAFGQFAGAALVLCGLLARRLAGRSYGNLAALAVLGVAILVDGVPYWGSDVGGVLALVPALGMVASRLSGHRLRWRTLLLWGAGTVVSVAAFAAVDLARPAAQRTHLGRLIESYADNGWGSLATVATRKLGANLAVITSSLWTAAVPIALLLVVYLLWRAPGRLRVVRATIPEVLGGLAVVGFLGFALNDSGIAVPGVMLGVVNASLVYLAVRSRPATQRGVPVG